MIVTAADRSSIQAIAGGLGVGVGVGGIIGVGASLGVAAANNNIANTVQAYVDGSAVTSAGMVELSASEAASILTVTIGGAIAVGVGTSGGSSGLVGAGVALAVAGSDSNSVIANDVDAYIADGGVVTAQGGNVEIDASDTSSIIAVSGGLAGAVAVGAGLVSGALAASVGFAVATNDIQNSVLAYVDHATVQAPGHRVNLSAVETSTMTAVTVGGAVSISAAVGIGGAIAVAAGVGVSANTVDNTVEAYLADNAVVTTTVPGSAQPGAILAGADVNLSATDSPHLTAITVAASVGLAVGLGSVALTLSTAAAANDDEDTVEAYSSNSTINSAGKLNLTALMPTSARIQATVVAASVAGAIGFGGSFAGAGADATNTVHNTIQAFIQGPSATAPSTATANGDITLTAAENAEISSQIVSVAVAAGYVAGSVGLSLSNNTVTSSISAYVNDARVTSTGGGITIGASSDDSVATVSVATSVAAALGAAGAGAQANAEVSPTVAAYAGSGAILSAANDISVAASTTNSANAITVGVAAAFVAVGASVATASTNGSVSAHVNDMVAGCSDLTIQATATDSTNALSVALAGGIFAASGDAAVATTSPTVAAAINNNASINSTGTVAVGALQTPTAQAETIGVNVGGVAIGASVSTATVSGMTSSYLGNSVTISAASLLVEATQDATENSSAIAAAGGILAGANASASTATNDGTVTATTGSVNLNGGNVTILAGDTSSQDANATGVTVGGIFALGLNFANATSSVATSAELGAGSTTNLSGTLEVSAIGTDQNDASAVAGSGALIAGNAAYASTSDNSTVGAALGGGVIGAYAVVLDARNDSEYDDNVDSANAALAGYSGAGATNTDTTSATASVANGTSIVATNAVEITAENLFTPGLTGQTGQVNAGAGGVFIGSAASIATTLAGTAQVLIGSNVTIDVITPTSNANSAGIVLSASSSLQTNDVVSLSTGGFAASASTSSSLTATLTNTVQIGANDHFFTNQSITMDTDSTVNALNSSGTNTWGGLGAGAYANASTSVTSNQAVTLGSNSTLMALGDVILTPGIGSSYDAGTGLTTTTPTALAGDTDAESYVQAAIAVPGAGATTALVSNAALTIAPGDQVISGEDTNLAADPGTTDPIATGVGHGTSYILFGIPISYTNGSSTAVPNLTSSNMTIDGTVIAGYFHELNIVIPNAQNVSYNNGSGTVLYTNASAITVNPDGQPFAPFSAYFTTAFNPANTIGALAPTSGTSQDPLGLSPQQLAAIQLAQGYVAPGTVGAIELGTLSAAGGDVTVDAQNLQGNGVGSITAYGGATISVTNNSPDYLILDSVDIQGGLGGNINFTGAATNSAASGAGIALSAVNPNGKPVVNIQETYSGTVGGPTSQKPDGIGPAVFMSASLPAVTFTGTLTAGSAVISIAGTTGLQIGQSVTGTGIPQGATIQKVTATSITLSAAATATGTEGLTAAGGLAAFDAGSLDNPHGQVTINVVNGSLIQTESVNAASVSTTAANGFDLVYEPNNYYPTGANPADGYNLNSVMIFPGSSAAAGQSLTAQQSADLAVAWAANALAAADGYGPFPATPSGDLALNESGPLTNNASNTSLINLSSQGGEDDMETYVWFAVGGTTSPIPYSENTGVPTGTSQGQAQSFDANYLIVNADKSQNLGAVPLSSTAMEFNAQLNAISPIAQYVGNISQLRVGEQVSGPSIPSGTTIKAINVSADTITLSANPTAYNGQTTYFHQLYVPTAGSSTNPGSGDGWFPAVPVEPLSLSVSSLPAAPAATTFNGKLTNNSNTVTGIGSTAGLYPGQIVSGTGIPQGVTITAVNSSAGTITLSANATAGGSVALSAAFQSSLNAGALFIDAEYIDINDPVNVNTGTSLSVNLPASLRQTIAGYKGTADLVLTRTTLSSGASYVTAYYDPKAGQIVVNNLSASTAGFVSLDGGIISTSSNGSINVGDGLGTVSIQNQTGYPVVIHNVSASPAPGSTEVSQVNITDTLQTQSSYPQTLYVYDPGGGIEVYQGKANADAQDLQQGLASGDWLAPTLVAGGSTTYTPLAGMRLAWQYEATLTRSFSWTPTASTQSLNWIRVPTVGQWQFSALSTADAVVGQPNWEYFDPTTGAAESVPTTELLLNQPAGAVFQESISLGGLSTSDAVNWWYSPGTDGFANDSNAPYATRYTGFDPCCGGQSMVEWDYLFPTSASLVLTDSVSASNPIGIHFTGPSQSSVSISSDASVALDGQIVNTAGTTTVTVQADSSTNSKDPLSITQGSASATIATDDLTLTAPGGAVGTALRPLNASLTPTKFFSGKLTAGSPSVYVATTQGVYVGENVAGTGVPTGTIIQAIDSTTFSGHVGSAHDFETAIWVPYSPTTAALVSELFAGESITGPGIPAGTTLYPLNGGLPYEVYFDAQLGRGYLVGLSTFETNFDAQPDIVETFTATGITLSKNATVSGTETLSASATLNASGVAIGGLLNLASGSQGAYLNLASGALLDTVIAGSSTNPGNVNLAAASDLIVDPTLASGTTNVVGKSITITSSAGAIGTGSAPLLIQGSGVVNMTALGNIFVTQVASDLKLGQIISTGGNVSISVPRGSIKNTSGLNFQVGNGGSQGSSLSQVLNLSPSQAQAGSRSSIAAFQNEVDSEYRSYWQLIKNGSVHNNVLTLNSQAVALYTAMAASVLNVTNPSNAQVQAYANTLYQGSVSFFAQYLGSSWMTLPAFTTYNPGFNYAATQAQVASLTTTGWTPAMLENAILQEALDPSTGAPVGISAPNVSGVDVTLNVANNIGQNASQSFLTWEQLLGFNLLSWGSGSGVPTTGKDLTIAGLDGGGLLHIRTFDDAGVRTDLYETKASNGALHLVTANSTGNVVSDVLESSLTAAQAGAISDLKQQLPGLVPPHALSSNEAAQVFNDLTSIAGHPLPSTDYSSVLANATAPGDVVATSTGLQVTNGQLYVSAPTQLNMTATTGSITVQGTSSNLSLGSVTAPGAVNIATQGSILDAYQGASIQTSSLISLTAATGDIGSRSWPLTVPPNSVTAYAPGWARLPELRHRRDHHRGVVQREFSNLRPLCDVHRHRQCQRRRSADRHRQLLRRREPAWQGIGLRREWPERRLHIHDFDAGGGQSLHPGRLLSDPHLPALVGQSEPDDHPGAPDHRVGQPRRQQALRLGGDFKQHGIHGERPDRRRHRAGRDRDQPGAAANAAVGTYPITATGWYGTGFSNYTVTYLNGSLTVSAATTSTTVTSPSNTLAAGQPVSFTAAVSNTSGTTAAPTGSVQFQVNGTNVGSPVPLNGAGVATSPSTSLPVGTDAIKAIFTSATSNFAGSSGTVSNVQVVQPQGLVVTNANDSGPGSLRAAIATADAGAGDTITFASTLAGQTIHLTTIGDSKDDGYSALTITTPMTIDASAAPGLTIAGPGTTGGSKFRVFYVSVPTGESFSLINATVSGGVAFDPTKYYSHPNGGALLLANGSAALTGVTITGNSAILRGGGVYSDGASIELVNCIITGNSARDGGGVSVYGHGTATLTDSIFTGNSAYGAGGGLASGYSTVTLTDCTITGNTAAAGGGIQNLGGTLYLYDSTVSGNDANRGTVFFGEGGFPYGRGGGIDNFDGTLTARGSSLINNFASNSGGALDNQAVYFAPSTANLIDCTITGNSATNDGGGIINGNYSTVTLSDSDLSGNEAGGDGGGLMNDGFSGQARLYGSSISNNSAEDGGGIATIGASTRYFGPIGAATSVTDCTISGNTAASRGGGVETFKYGVTTVSGSTVSGNSAGGSGGGLWNEGGTTLVNSTLSGNRAGRVWRRTVQLPVQGLLQRQPLLCDAGRDPTDQRDRQRQQRLQRRRHR